MARWATQPGDPIWSIICRLAGGTYPRTVRARCHDVVQAAIEEGRVYEGLGPITAMVERPDGSVGRRRGRRDRRRWTSGPCGRRGRGVTALATTSWGAEVRTVVDGLWFGEGPRWHDGSLWCSDIHGHRVLRVEVDDLDEAQVHTVVE